MELELKKYGSVLASRPLGKQVRSEILEMLSNLEYVVFNLEGVEIVSNSFADECFGKLLLEMDLKLLKSKTTFKNSSPFVQTIISYAFNERVKTLQHA